MSVFTLDGENELRRKEDYFFLTQEIDYGLSLCLGSSEDRTFYQDLKQRFELLKEALRVIKSKHRLIFRTGSKSALERELLDESFVIFSDVLEDITSTITQRRLKEAMFLRGKPLTTSRFQLSEVHVDYGDTFRCIEEINHCCWQTLKVFFSNIKHNCTPLTAVSRGHGYGLEFFPAFNMKTVFCDPTDKERVQRENFLRYLILLSRITGPRAFPMHIRSAPLLAHEQFHVVIHIAQKAIADLADEESHHDIQLDTESELYVSDLYGRYYVPLIRLYLALRRSLLRFFDCFGSKLVNLIQEITGKEFEKGQLRFETKARRHANEFLADIAGLMMAGPSFLFAFISEILRNRATWLEMEQPFRYHPPACVRVKLLLDILKDLGFEELHKLSCCLVNSYFTGFEPHYDLIYNLYKEKWLDPNMGLLRKCASFLRHAIELQPSELRHYKKLLRSPLGAKANEETWKDERRGIIISALNNHVYQKDQSYTATDILNAIWLKIVCPEWKGSPHKGLVWRLMLSKGGSAYGRETQ